MVILGLVISQLSAIFHTNAPSMSNLPSSALLSGMDYFTYYETSACGLIKIGYLVSLVDKNSLIPAKTDYLRLSKVQRRLASRLCTCKTCQKPIWSSMPTRKPIKAVGPARTPSQTTAGIRIQTAASTAVDLRTSSLMPLKIQLHIHQAVEVHSCQRESTRWRTLRCTPDDLASGGTHPQRQYLGKYTGDNRKVNSNNLSSHKMEIRKPSSHKPSSRSMRRQRFLPGLRSADETEYGEFSADSSGVKVEI